MPDVPELDSILKRLTDVPGVFDPERAQPLTDGAQMAPGDRVRVRFVGYRYHGRVLRKALVEREEA